MYGENEFFKDYFLFFISLFLEVHFIDVGTIRNFVVLCPIILNFYYAENT